MKYETLLASENITHGTDAQQKGALAALVTKIVDNLQISVEGVHIRFEDDQQVNKEGYVEFIVKGFLWGNHVRAYNSTFYR